MPGLTVGSTRSMTSCEHPNRSTCWAHAWAASAAATVNVNFNAMAALISLQGTVRLPSLGRPKAVRYSDGYLKFDPRLLIHRAGPHCEDTPIGSWVQSPHQMSFTSNPGM